MKRPQILIMVLVLLIAAFPFYAPRTLAAPSDTCISEWAPVAMAVPASGYPDLVRVSSSSPENVWAVGALWWPGDVIQRQTLIERWDGAEWKIIPGPNISGDLDQLSDVAVLSASDVWAVGSSVDTDGVSHILVVHWDGAALSIVAPPAGFEGEGELVSVSGVAGDDVWAVGSYGDSSLILHWNGSNWQSVPSPLDGAFTRVIAKASNDVWALGEDVDHKATILRWNGSNWAIVSWFQLQHDLVGGPYFFIESISDFVVVVENDIWVVGVYSGKEIYDGRRWHWDGSSWSGSEPAPGIHPDSPVMGIAGSGSDDLWSIGNRYGDRIFSHRSGTGWTEYELQKLIGGSWLEGITQVSDSEFWVVGSSHPPMAVQGIFTCNTPPSEDVTLLSPAEGQVMTDLEPTFVWQDTADTGYYNLEWFPDQPGADKRVYEYLPGPALAWPDYSPPENGEYSWRVQACNYIGCGEWSDLVTWLQQVQAPETPGLLSPPAGATIAYRSITATWTAESNTEFYRIELYKASTVAAPFQQHDWHENSYVWTIEEEGKYYWRVQACNPGGCGDWSEMFDFTIYFPPPPRPVLLSPGPRVVLDIRRPVLKWESSADDAAYLFQVRSKSRKGPVVITRGAGIQEQWRLRDPLPNGQYYWRVKACNAEHRCSKWSKGRKFVVYK